MLLKKNENNPGIKKQMLRPQDVLGRGSLQESPESLHGGRTGWGRREGSAPMSWGLILYPHIAVTSPALTHTIKRRENKIKQHSKARLQI